MFLKVAWLVLRRMWRSKPRRARSVHDAVLRRGVCAVFSFAFVKEGVPVEGAGVGILWIAIIFSGNLALGRTFERERYGETIRALLLVPAPRAAIYVGKLLGIVALLSLTELLLVPMVAFLFQAPLFSWPIHLVALLALGTIGFSSVGTLFAAMLMRSRTRDVLLPILLYPVTVPVIIAGVLGTSAPDPDPGRRADGDIVDPLLAFSTSCF